MDTYCEQLVEIKKGAKYYLGLFGLWFAVIVIAYLSLVFLRPLSAILTVAAGYGAYYLTGFLSIEYEYIITNGALDIDIIYAKRSRKRLASLELKEVEGIEKYNGEALDKNKFKTVCVACNKNDGNAYKLIFSGEAGLKVAVISPDERTREEIIKFVPRFVGNTAFR